MTLAMKTTNTGSTQCLLCSSVKAARPHHYLNMQITKFFKDYLKNEITLPTQTKNMRRSKGYTDELEKFSRDNSNLLLTVKLKAAATKKLRLRVTGYSQAEYYYTLSNKGMIISYKNYSISKEIDIAA